ncbi:MAG: translation elongation factor EF-1 subunit alpha [Candidatus Hodarchaeota archaeon]
MTKLSKKEKPHANMVVIGHVDNGKSTLMGHLLIDAGAIPNSEIRKLEQKARDLNRKSWWYAFVFDTLKEEQAGGITIDTSFKKFETKTRYWTIIDAPGHVNYIKNMIKGTSQADVAILVISAKTSEYDTAIGLKGQGREHAFLAKTLGVRKIIVAINKMDDNSVRYSEKRYNEVREGIQELLINVGYNIKNDVEFVPVSGYIGDNLVEKSQNIPWWQGPTLIEAIDSIPEIKYATDKPLRILVQDVYRIKGTGIVPVGKVETGVIRIGMKVLASPSGFIGEVKSIEMHHESLNQAEAGDNIGFSLRGLTPKDIKKGDIVSEIEKPCPIVTPNGFFKAKIIVLDHPTAITQGYTPVVFAHAAQVACRFLRLIEKLDPRSGKVIESEPQFIKKGDVAVVEMKPTKKLPIEQSSDFIDLSRIIIRDMGQTVAVGLVTEIIS